MIARPCICEAFLAVHERRNCRRSSNPPLRTTAWLLRATAWLLRASIKIESRHSSFFGAIVVGPRPSLIAFQTPAFSVQTCLSLLHGVPEKKRLFTSRRGLRWALPCHRPWSTAACSQHGWYITSMQHSMRRMESQSWIQALRGLEDAHLPKAREGMLQLKTFFSCYRCARHLGRRNGWHFASRPNCRCSRSCSTSFAFASNF